VLCDLFVFLRNILSLILDLTPQSLDLLIFHLDQINVFLKLRLELDNQATVGLQCLLVFFTSLV